jgi:hypothetical protein
MNGKPHLTMKPWVEGQPLLYKCSLCEQAFVFPEDRSPKEGAAEVWAAFLDHVKKEHPQDVEN